MIPENGAAEIATEDAGGGAVVLVADDDRGVRQSVCEILEAFGYRVISAEDGEEAVTQLASHEVDAVVLDIKMPKRDGLSVLRQLVPEPPPPGVIIVSAYDVSDETRNDLGRRVCNVLRKPVAPLSLLEAVAGAVAVARNAGAA